jgi:hypothetical protein
MQTNSNHDDSKGKSRQSHAISIGTVLIRNDVLLPPWFYFRIEECGDWKKVLDATAYELELLARRTGWSFSYIEPPVKGGTVNVGKRPRINNALKKIMDAVRKSGFNSFEITDITIHRMLAMHYISLTVHPRQLRPNPFIRDPYPYHHPHQVWDFEHIPRRGSKIQPQSKGI